MNHDITFLCQFFYPETVSSATLPFDTAAHLASCGYRVSALCGYPKEYSNQKNVPLQETTNAVEISRLKYLQLRRGSSIGRLINYFSFTLKAWMNVRKLKRSRSVIVYSNPPVLPLAAIRAKKKYGTKLVFVAYDVYPEVAYASGTITPGSLLDKVMHKVNQKLYRYADTVVVLTDEMKHYLLQNRPELTEDRVITIENWAHEKESAVLQKDTAEKFGLQGKEFIVGYFGNLGTCQDIDTMLQAAKLLKDDDSVGFLIVGHGNKKESARSFVEEHNLKNVRIYDYLVGEDFAQAVALANCTVVSLEPGLKGTCAPSKYYSCLLGGHPVIGVVEPGSYLARELEEKQVGCHVANGDSAAFCKAVKALQDDPHKLSQMSLRAKTLYAERYDYPIAMEKYQAVFEKLL